MSSGVYWCEERGFVLESDCDSSHFELVLTDEQRRTLSGFMTWALRHAPDGAGISVDEHGWTDVDELVKQAKNQHEWVTRKKMAAVVSLDSKGRFEVDGNRIRATYAHSIDVVIDSQSDKANIPDVLYHGTPIENKDSILSEGLKPMGRQEVHLTSSKDLAIETGNRHDDTVILLEIEASEMLEDGFSIVSKGESIYTTSEIPPEYLAISETVHESPHS